MLKEKRWIVHPLIASVSWVKAAAKADETSELRVAQLATGRALALFRVY
jgi:hypothetical protein